jgi:cullin 3
MRISRDMQDSYKTYKRAQASQQQVEGETSGSGKPIDIEVDVLTNGYWPSQNIPPCILPQQVQDAIARYTKFYLEKHTGRKLSWQTSAGSSELKATFGSDPKYRKHELGVSTYQMCILLLFNDSDSLTLGQIRSKTQIPDLELRRHLVSLCTPKHRILRKGSRGRGITSDDDTFTFNPDYGSKLKRVRIPLVKETSVSKGGGDGTGTAGGGSASASAVDGSVPLKVEEDRRHLVEAAIVRIMKARKSLGHNDLFAEVTRQLSVRFTPSPQFVKKRIESLIEREYLERSQQDHRLYSYVA